MTCVPTDRYRNNYAPSWCKGCSYFGVLNALTDVFAQRQLESHRISVVSGIGCSSRLPLYLTTYGLHTLHGRALPVAIGCRLARPDIPVVVVAGDGDMFSIGIGHFVTAARKNFDCTVICLDNRMYAMTKNQASATSPLGYNGTLTPDGMSGFPLNAVEFAIACKATFVARTFAGDQVHMRKIIGNAFDHHGFSFVHVLAPCRTFERTLTLASLSSRIVDINRGNGHDPSNMQDALQASSHALDFDNSENDPVPVGIYWEADMPSCEDLVSQRKTAVEQRNTLRSILDEFSV